MQKFEDDLKKSTARKYKYLLGDELWSTAFGDLYEASSENDVAASMPRVKKMSGADAGASGKNMISDLELQWHFN